MRPWIQPAAVVAVVVGAAVSGTLVGPQPIPQASFSAANTKASVVCPGLSSITAQARLGLATTGEEASTAPLGDPAKSTSIDPFTVQAKANDYLRLSALLPAAFGGVLTVQAASGPERGLSAVACGAPDIEHWFAGVDLRESAQSEVVVANLDQTSASVDLTIYTEDGAVPGPRGILVEGNADRTISLSNLERSAGPVTVQVASSDGRVAAFVRQRTWNGAAPLGADWLPAAAAPATDAVIPGLPAGAGERRLVLTNPSERTTTVKLSTLTTSGPGEPVGVNEVQLPAGATRSVDLGAALSEQPVALVLHSDQPVAAAVWADAGSRPAQHDPAYTAAGDPLASDSIWPVAFGKSFATVLQLANPTDAEQRVQLTAGTKAASGTPQEIVLAPQSITEVKLDAAAANLVRLQTESDRLHGALISTGRLGAVRAVSILDLAGGRSVTPAEVVFDPHTGS